MIFSSRLFTILTFTVYVITNSSIFQGDTQLPFSLDEEIALSSESKRWLLALPALVNRANGESHTTLEVELISREATAEHSRRLQEWWGIKNRNDLLKQISKLEEHGHNERYQRLLELLIVHPDMAPQKIVAVYHLTRKDKNYLNFLSENLEKAQQTELLAWDWGRAAALARWGYQSGYLEEREAWIILRYYGEKIQADYNSWKEYGRGYAFGRLFWASGFNGLDKFQGQTEEVLEILLSEHGLWANIAWNVDLGS